MSSSTEKICVKCGSTDGALNEIGKFWHENDEEEGVPKKKKKIHPLDTIIQHAQQLEMEGLVSTLEESKKNNVTVYIHYSCRTELRIVLDLENVVNQVDNHRALTVLAQNHKMMVLILKLNAFTAATLARAWKYYKMLQVISMIF